MATSNYFSVGGRVVFFDDFEEASIHRALREARELQQIHTVIDGASKKVPPLSIFRENKLSGPWRALPEIAGSTVRAPFAVH